MTSACVWQDDHCARFVDCAASLRLGGNEERRALTPVHRLKLTPHNSDGTASGRGVCPDIVVACTEPWEDRSSAVFISVAKGPGLMAFTVMPSSASSNANARVKPIDVPRSERNARARSTQRQGHCFAQSFTGPCDDCHLTVQVMFAHCTFIQEGRRVPTAVSS